MDTTIYASVGFVVILVGIAAYVISLIARSNKNR